MTILYAILLVSTVALICAAGACFIRVRLQMRHSEAPRRRPISGFETEGERERQAAAV